MYLLCGLSVGEVEQGFLFESIWGVPNCFPIDWLSLRLTQRKHPSNVWSEVEEDIAHSIEIGILSGL
jgi:hypothetical protein